MSVCIRMKRIDNKKRFTFGLLYFVWICLLSACIHTEQNNWPLQPFSQDYWPSSHTTCVVCVNFIHKWWDQQFKVRSESTDFSRNFSWQFLFTLKKYFSYFVLMFGLGYEPWLSSNKPTHYLLDNGDYQLAVLLNQQLIRLKQAIH